MRIGELATQTGVNPKTIRYYEHIALLPDPGRTGGGYRDYDDNAADRITFIKTAQRLGMRLDEIREILSLRDRGQQPCQLVRRTLRNQVTEIDERIRELQQLRDELITLDAWADDRATSDAPGCPIIDHSRARSAAQSTDRHAPH